MKVAVFIERDGLLAQVAGSNGAPKTALRLEDFRVRDEAVGPLEALRRAGFMLFATTNQPGVTSGAPPRRELDLMHAVLTRKLGLDGVLVCPHAPDDPCNCRKPRPGLLREAAHEHKLDLEHSFVVSDRWEDSEMAEAAGATSVMVRSKLNGNGHHDCVVSDLNEVATKIMEIAREAGTLRHITTKAS